MRHARAGIELSIIAPCFNEEGNVAELCRRTLGTLDAARIEGELLLIDDGSADGTWQRIEEQARTEPRVRGVRHPQNRGIEGGWRSGLDAARGQLVCLIDSDLQNPPEDIARLYAAYLAERPDLVQAVRHPKNVHSRALFSRGLNLLLNTSFGMTLRDNKSGFVLCAAPLLRELLEHRYQYRYFQCFIGCAAGVRGCRIVEVDSDFEPRQAGSSFLAEIPIRTSLRVFGELLKYRLETL